MRAAIVMSGVGRKNERGEQVFLLPLEMAEKIVRHDGWDLGRVQRYLFDEGQGVAAFARRHPSHRDRRRRLQDELPADLGRRLADGDAGALAAQTFQPSQSQTPRPITPSRSAPFSQGISSVNMVTPWR